MTTRASKWTNRPAGLVLGVALAAALITIFVVFRSQGLVANRPDPYGFGALGRDIAEGRGFGGVLIGRRAPLYPLFIGILYAVFGEHEVLVQLAQSVFFMGTAYLAWDMGSRLYNARTGLIAGLLCALHPSLLRYVPDFHLESFFTFLFTWCIWSSVRLYRRTTVANGVWFGVAAGFASLTKAVLLLYPPLFLGFLWWTRRRAVPAAAGTRSMTLTFGVVLAAMALTISPWTVRN